MASWREPLRRSLVSAAILSLIVPGFGQFYAGRRTQGVVLICCYALSSFIVWLTLVGLLPRFWMLVAAIVVLVLVYLVALVDAVMAAAGLESYVRQPYNRWYVYAGIVVVFLAAQTILTQAAASFLRGPGYYQIPSASMAPTLRPGETLLVDVLYFRQHAPQRGDVVAFDRPRQPGERSIMRVVAVSGDRVSVVRGRAVVNGQTLNEPYADLGDPAVSTDTPREWTVPADAVFVLGDNRSNSADSRLYGPVPLSSLIGRATDIVTSDNFDRVGKWIGTPPDVAH